MNIDIRRLGLVAAIWIALLGSGLRINGVNVGSPNAYSKYTPQPSLDSEAIQFAVIGDYGKSGSAASAVAGMVKGWQPDFIITTGDNNYANGLGETIDRNIGQYYSQYIYPYYGVYAASDGPNRFFPALGNHDWHADKVQTYLDYFPISISDANTGSSNNERYYDFIQGPVHFFVLDSGPHGTPAIEDEQIAWLQTQLAASTSLWQIVYFHHPPYSSGAHGSYKSRQLPFQDWGADAVLTGHDHNYERILHNGIPYFVNGLGGKSIRNFRFAAVEGSQMRYNDDYGAMWVEATETTLTFQFYTIANGGMLVDNYSLFKVE